MCSIDSIDVLVFKMLDMVSISCVQTFTIQLRLYSKTKYVIMSTIIKRLANTHLTLNIWY